MNLTSRVFAEAGNALTASTKGFRTAHEPVHRSTSGACVMIFADSDRWYCSSCHQQGDAADALVSLTGISRADADAQVQQMAGPQAAGHRKEPHATTLRRLAAQAVLLRTADDQRYAYAAVGEHRELLGLTGRGAGFRDWLIQRFRQETAALPSQTALSQVLEAVAAQCRFDGVLCEVHCRLAVHEDTLYYDLGTPTREAVQVTPDGWRVLPSTGLPVYFRRPRGMLPLPAPDPTGTMADFYALLPVDQSTPEGMLITAWALGTFLPHGAYTHLAVHGEQGSAKSTLTRTLRMLLDPNKAPARSTPKDEQVLFLAAQNGSVVALENLSHLPDWLSDALCCLSTGAGFSARMLYTDEEEHLFSVQRPAIFNGIAEVAVRGDLVDRTLFVTLPAIPEAQRKQEAHVWRDFATRHAKALGALLTAVSTALQRSPRTLVAASPRMADFARWVEAAAPALGWKRGAFLQVYEANRQAANRIELDASMVASTLLDYLADVGAVDEVLMKDLLRHLTNHLTEYGEKPVPTSWPKSPQSLRAHLRRLAPALRRQGWTLTFLPHTDKGSPVTIAPGPPTAIAAPAPTSAPTDELDELYPAHKSSSVCNVLNNREFYELDELDELPLSLGSKEKKEREEQCDSGRTSTKGAERQSRTISKSSSGSRSSSVLDAADPPSVQDFCWQCGDDTLHVLDTAGTAVCVACRTLPAVTPAQAEACLSPVTIGASSEMPDVEYVTTAARLQAVLPELLAAPVLGLDTETTGLDPLNARLRLVQFALPARTVVIDAQHCPLPLLAPVLSNPQTVFLGHHLKFDLKFLATAGLPWPAKVRDTMLESMLLHAGTNAGQLQHSSLHAVVARTLDQQLDKTLQTSEWSGALSPEQLTYAARDAAILLPLADALHHQCQAAGLERVGALEAACVPALAWMELAGVPLDAPRWTERAQLEAHRALGLEAELYALLRQSANGHAHLLAEAVNWESPSQVLTVLQDLGHAVTATDSATLTRLAPSAPLAALLLEYREAKKRASTYGAAWLKKHLHPLTGRIHADYLQLGSVAGRMSCTKPNMQQLPRGPLYRSCIRPEEGRAIVKADYSQIELRIAALIAKEPSMLRAFQAGEDLHRVTAARVLGIDVDAVSSAHRQLAKALNFGLLYGMGATRLREHALTNYKVVLTPAEAVQHRRAFFQLYPGLQQWHQATAAALEESGTSLETRTLTGRRRLGVDKYTNALNTPVQGSGADGMKLALARLFAHRQEVPDARLILTVHDELVAECPADTAEETAAWLTRHMVAAMEDVTGGGVPIVVDTQMGQDWAGLPLPVLV